MVYLIHFDAPLSHARHYIGFTTCKLSQRMEAHRNGTGSRLMKAVTLAGIGWNPVRVWKDGDRTFERQLKNQKNSSSHCPICNPVKKIYLYKQRKKNLSGRIGAT